MQSKAVNETKMTQDNYKITLGIEIIIIILLSFFIVYNLHRDYDLLSNISHMIDTMSTAKKYSYVVMIYPEDNDQLSSELTSYGARGCEIASTILKEYNVGGHYAYGNKLILKCPESWVWSGR